MATIIQMPKPPGEPEEPKISQMDLSECVALHNEIRLMRGRLAQRREYLRQRVEGGMEVEDGPLKSFAARIARACFP